MKKYRYSAEQVSRATCPVGKDGTIRASNRAGRRSRRDTLFLTFDAPGQPLLPTAVGWPESGFWGHAGWGEFEVFEYVFPNT